MPELIDTVLATPGLYWLITAAIVGGLVRGFSGFGSALIFLPVAGQFLSPFHALTVLIIIEMIGPIPNLGRALRDGHCRDIAILISGLIVAIPLGVLVLSAVAPEVFRYGVSIITMLLLVSLISGWRYGGKLSDGKILGTGLFSGFLAGSVGLPGPPVILLYMAAPHAPKVIRANTMLFLFASDIVMLAVMAMFGKLVLSAIGLGVILAIPYLLANMAGAAIFRPHAESVYRIVAYIIIAFSAINGLPFLD